MPIHLTKTRAVVNNVRSIISLHLNVTGAHSGLALLPPPQHPETDMPNSNRPAGDPHSVSCNRETTNMPMQFAPIEGEFWVVEMQTTPDDPDYIGPFATVEEAREWGRAQGSTWSDFVTIHVWSPRVWQEDHAEDES